MPRILILSSPSSSYNTLTVYQKNPEDGDVRMLDAFPIMPVSYYTPDDDDDAVALAFSASFFAFLRSVVETGDLARIILSEN